jgi:hypothetical protein
MPPKNRDATSALDGVVPFESASADDADSSHHPQVGRKTKKSRREQYPPGWLTNDRGNLRFVAVTVRHPCKFFFVILLVTLVMVAGLFMSFSDSESDSGPFSEPGGEYDTNDVRSLAYDSLKFAIEEVEDVRDEDNNGSGDARQRRLVEQVQHSETTTTMTTVRDVLMSTGLFPSLDKLLAKGTTSRSVVSSTGKAKTKASTRRRRQRRQLQGNDNVDGEKVLRTQEQVLDITYWVYEADGKNTKGVFGSADSIRAMRESHDLFLKDIAYETYCWREYEKVVAAEDSNGTTETTSRCRPPTSSLNVYYPRSYNPDITASVIDQLADPTKVVTYNAVSVCLEFGLLCDTIPVEYNTTDVLAWADELNANITVLSDTWDGTGDLVEEQYIDQVTTLIAHLLQLRTKRGLVDFGLDKNFSLNNTVSQYSRAIFYWGGPLSLTSNATNDVLSEEDKEDEDEEALKE